MNKQKYAKNAEKSRIKSAITGLALLALTSFPDSSKAGLTGSTKLEIYEEDLAGTPRDSLFVDYRTEAFVNSGIDPYDVLKSEAGAPAFPEGLIVYSKLDTEEKLAVDARQRNQGNYSFTFEPVGNFQTDKARIKFSNIAGNDVFSYSFFGGSGLTSDNGGYTDYFSYNSSSGNFSMDFTPVLEPSSLGLLGLGLGILGLKRFLRKK